METPKKDPLDFPWLATVDELERPVKLTKQQSAQLRRIKALREQAAEHGISIDVRAEAQGFADRNPELMIEVAKRDAFRDMFARLDDPE